MPVTSRADLYSASAAAEKKDFARAFELYRETGGDRPSRSPGKSRGDVRQWRRREARQRARLRVGCHCAGKWWWRSRERHRHATRAAPECGRACADRRSPGAIRKGRAGGTPAAAALCRRRAGECRSHCEMRSVANPDNFYPVDAKRQRISGTVLVEATVAPDGRARNARVWYSLPANVFDEAGRRVAFASTYEPPKENGVAVACTIRFKVRFCGWHGSGIGARP